MDKNQKKGTSLYRLLIIFYSHINDGFENVDLYFSLKVNVNFCEVQNERTLPLLYLISSEVSGVQSRMSNLLERLLLISKYTML